MKIELMCLAMSRYFGIRSIKIKLQFTFRNNNQSMFFLSLTVDKKGYFFRETLELLNRSSDVGDPFW